MLEPLFETLKKAQARLALENRRAKDAALGGAAQAVNRRRREILEANDADLRRARAGGMPEALLDRLALNERRVDAMIEGIEDIRRQEDPVGRLRRGWPTAEGLLIEEITVPLGVAAIIYESRPNVTADAAALAYKAGCGILLRGSQAALASNRAICGALREGIEAAGGVADAVALAESCSREEVDEILQARGRVDVVIPRGGGELIRRVIENARVPVIETGEGNCHIYAAADAAATSAWAEQAVNIIENAKMQKPGACNAVETLLVHREAAPALLPLLAKRLAGRAELRCDGAAKVILTAAAVPALQITDAAEADWETEFLDYVLAVKTVHSLDEAVAHINRYGTGHSEAILTNNLADADEFCRRVDAACVYVNASTRFTDGGEFGFGAELGISTQKLHARGPMGLEALTTVKYRVTGAGQVRR